MKSQALKVAAGILASRLLGFVRSALQARFLGVGAHSDVLTATLRLPNLLQNLLGEQSLSAAFIPIYSRLLEEGREEEAGRFAGAIFGLLTAAAGSLALVGVLLARPIVAVFSSGFLRNDPGAAVDRYELAVQGVQIVFPMAAILVLSAWCLGVLNSHRRFLLPYMAPVAWNAVIIAAFLYFGGEVLARGEIAAADKTRLYFAVCWGALAGGVLQFLVQLPSVLRVLRGFRPSVSLGVTGVREALAAFGPVVAGRGVVNLSGYLDIWLATLFTAGAVSALEFTTRLYVLPIALFALSVAAAELPELSRLAASEEGSATRRRVDGGLRQVAFLAVPTVVGYLGFGYLLVGAIYRRGEFGAQSHWLVYGTLCLFTLGLLPTTLSRLLTNAFYAGGDTRTPAKIAVGRVLVGAAIAAPAMWILDRFTLAPWLNAEGPDLHLGALGLGIGSAAAAWVEITLLRRRLGRRLEGFQLPVAAVVRMAALALAAAVPAAAVWWWAPDIRLVVLAPIVVGIFATLYLGGAFWLGFPEGEAWLRLARRER
jgi:putative peptidoglycan lipid II flippase